MKQDTTQCVICGAEFPSAIVWSIPTRENHYTPKPYRKEICDKCVAPIKPGDKPKPSGKVYRYNTDPLPYVQLAGEIENRVLHEYRTVYEKALDSADAMRFEVLLTDDEKAFLQLHARITASEGMYHQALTMSNFPDLLDAARCDAERSDERFLRMRSEGYDIFRRGEAYRKWRKEQDKKST